MLTGADVHAVELVCRGALALVDGYVPYRVGAVGNTHEYQGRTVVSLRYAPFVETEPRVVVIEEYLGRCSGIGVGADTVNVEVIEVADGGRRCRHG